MGLTALSDNFWKYVSSTECRWSFLDRVRSRAPVIQRSLPVPTCPGAWCICGPVEGLGRCPSRFLSSALGGFPLPWALGMSSIVLCRGVVRGDVTGQVRLCILENRQ